MKASGSVAGASGQTDAKSLEGSLDSSIGNLKRRDVCAIYI